MDPTLPAPSATAPAYHLPALLHDICLLDLLELCGTTVHTSRLLQLSQPTISRRYQSLAQDFGLVRNRHPLRGCGYGTSTSMRLLRLACRAHRLAAGVARIGADMLHHPLLAGFPWLLPSPERFRAAASWLELVRQGVLDGALISGLELETTEGVNRRELALVPLGEWPLALGGCPELTLQLAGGSTVLVPDRAVAPGLRRQLQELGLSLRNGGNSLRTTNDWIRRIRGTNLALVVADQDVESWSSLRRWPLPMGLGSPVWLALSADWQEHPVLRLSAQELGIRLAPPQPERRASPGASGLGGSVVADRPNGR